MSFIALHEKEQVVMVVRKHWFVLVGPVVSFLVMFFIPSILFAIFPSFDFLPFLQENKPLIEFMLSIYYLTALLLLFIFLMEYYLDMWIITTDRIIDIAQNGLFSREISEIPLQRVQDVTIDINGIIGTFLKFGTIRIQTAGEREFTITNIPRLQEIKEIILKNTIPGLPNEQKKDL